jgi:hypothetical protein
MHKDWMKNELSSFIEEEVIELPIGKERMKLNEITTNKTEDISKNPDGREISNEQVNMALFPAALRKIK